MKTLRFVLFLFLIFFPVVAEAVIAGPNASVTFRENRYEDVCDAYADLSTSLKVGLTGDSAMQQDFGRDEFDLTASGAYYHASVGGDQNCGASEEDPCEYYRTNYLNVPSNIYLPLGIKEDDTIDMTMGDVGFLSASQYAIGDNDSLGRDALYVRIVDGLDPDTKGSNYLVGSFGCSAPGQYAAMGIENQIDNEAIGGTFLSCDASIQCVTVLWPIYERLGDPEDNTQYYTNVDCAQAGNCDWIVSDGGYWDLVSDVSDSCNCNDDCDPCDSEGCIAAKAKIKTDMSNYVQRARLDSSNTAQFIIIGIGHVVPDNWDTCIEDINADYEDIADTYEYVYFIDPREEGISPEDTPDWYMQDNLHWNRYMRLYIGDKISEIINAN